MAGLWTNGLPAAAPPFTLAETVPVDTNLTAGQTPESEGASLQQFTLVHSGAVLPLVDGTSIAVDCTKGSYFAVTLGGNRTFVFNNPTAGQLIRLELTQDGTGSRTATWPATVTWPAGTAPTLTVTAGHTDMLTFVWNATASKWRGASSLNMS